MGKRGAEGDEGGDHGRCCAHSFQMYCAEGEKVRAVAKQADDGGRWWAAAHRRELGLGARAAWPHRERKREGFEWFGGKERMRGVDEKLPRG